MKKYEEGLTDKQLDEQIKKVGSLIPKEDENSKYQLVIVEGHIFEVDRSVPKIVNYKGPADGIIITASITQNGNWQNPVATVTGTITKYGGGTVISSSATAKVISTGATSTVEGFPTTGGSYTISNITEDTDITITAQDSEGHDPVTEVIKVRLVRDNTPPTISNATVTANMMKITISARATDNESGLASLTYSVSPTTVKPADDGKTKATGRLNPNGTPIEIETTAKGNYTVTFTATDNAGKTSTAIVEPVRTTDAMSIAALKEQIKQGKYPELIGTKVDYKSDDIVAWRLFYVEDSSNIFGDGVGTIYLKRDPDGNKVLTEYENKGMTENGLTMMKKLNPAWREHTEGEVKNGNKTTKDTFLGNEKAAAGLCDTDNWTSYKVEGVARYAIGGAPIEMWCKAQNVYRAQYDTSASIIGCNIKNANGYGYKINNGSLVNSQETTVVNANIEQSKVIATNLLQWLASPSSGDSYYVCDVYSSCANNNDYRGVSGIKYGIAPVACLNP